MDSPTQLPVELLIPIAMVVAAAVLAVIAMRLLRSGMRRKRYDAGQDVYQLNLADFQDGVIPADAPPFRIHGLHVHLPLIVVAPVGRGEKLPHTDLLPAILDRAVPGIRAVLESHQTTTVRWPAQLSTSGFRERFFKEIKLPGESGKGSMWTAAAGCFSAIGHRFSIGLLMRADAPNSLGKFPIDHDSQWLELFRVGPH